MEHIVLYSSQVYLSEDNTDPDSYIAKFVICDFGRNKNGVSLNRDGIESWLSTLKIKPLVGKIKMRYDGTYDFTGHNMKKVTKIDDNGNQYEEVEFDTDAFGTFYDIAIETINDKEMIVASCKIWKRFSKACDVIIRRIQNGTLHTSWEIAIEKSHQGIVDGFMTKIIDVGRFIGHCLLGENVSPAYDSSGLLEIASTTYDVEFAEALSQDMISHGLDKLNNQEKEDCILKKDEKNIVSSEKDVDEVPIDNTVSMENTEETANVKETSDAENPENTKETSEETPVGSEESDKSEHVETEISALTAYDLRNKLNRACRDKYKDWCWVSFLFPEEHEVWCEYDGESELDYLKFTYSVENDEITVSEPEKVKLSVSPLTIDTTIAEYEKTIAEKDELIIKTSSEISSLKSENTELSQYKEKFTQLEQEKVEAELAEKKETLISSVIKSGQITREEIKSSEELSGYVDNLDKASLMAIVGERVIASIENKPEQKVETVEVSNVHVTSNLNNDDDETVDGTSIMRKFLHK